MYKYKITNETEQGSPHEVNITNVLERINDEFMKNYREQMAQDEEEEKILERELEGSLKDNNDTDKQYTIEDNRNNRNPTGYVEKLTPNDAKPKPVTTPSSFSTA